MEVLDSILKEINVVDIVVYVIGVVIAAFIVNILFPVFNLGRQKYDVRHSISLSILGIEIAGNKKSEDKTVVLMENGAGVDRREDKQKQYYFASVNHLNSIILGETQYHRYKKMCVTNKGKCDIKIHGMIMNKSTEITIENGENNFVEGGAKLYIYVKVSESPSSIIIRHPEYWLEFKDILNPGVEVFLPKCSKNKRKCK